MEKIEKNLQNYSIEISNRTIPVNFRSAEEKISRHLEQRKRKMVFGEHSILGFGNKGPTVFDAVEIQCPN